MIDLLEDALRKLMEYCEAENYRGWDPYDGLNSKLLKFLTFNLKWSRIAVTHFMKRSPMNLRPILGVSKSRNPKAMGLLASTYLVRYKRSKRQEYLNKTKRILDWLITNNSNRYKSYSWGYDFDWQSRTFFIPKGCFVSDNFQEIHINNNEQVLQLGFSLN